MRNVSRGWFVDWGHLALLIFIGGIILAYLLDTRATSLKTNNLLLVQPVAIIALAVVVLILPQCFRRAGKVSDDLIRKETLAQLGKVAALASGLGVFALSLETVGFDVATFVFTASGIYICGERKLWLILTFSAVFTLCIIYGYQMLVPFPFPLTVL